MLAKKPPLSQKCGCDMTEAQHICLIQPSSLDFAKVPETGRDLWQFYVAWQSVDLRTFETSFRDRSHIIRIPPISQPPQHLLAPRRSLFASHESLILVALFSAIVFAHLTLPTPQQNEERAPLGPGRPPPCPQLSSWTATTLIIQIWTSSGARLCYSYRLKQRSGVSRSNWSVRAVLVYRVLGIHKMCTQTKSERSLRSTR
jgi:hypothetical protein